MQRQSVNSSINLLIAMEAQHFTKNMALLQKQKKTMNSKYVTFANQCFPLVFQVPMPHISIWIIVRTISNIYIKVSNHLSRQEWMVISLSIVDIVFNILQLIIPQVGTTRHYSFPMSSWRTFIRERDCPMWFYFSMILLLIEKLYQLSIFELD